jgi:hypothetical protein
MWEVYILGVQNACIRNAVTFLLLLSIGGGRAGSGRGNKKAPWVI